MHATAARRSGFTMYRLAATICVLMSTTVARAERVKALADVKGARVNQLVGYGIVAGLAGTGDDASTGLSGPSIVVMLQRLGVRIDQTQLRLRNVAAVMVTADLPPNAGAGSAIDVTVSSIGSARSLEGGTLLATPLKGADLKVYALAQGPMSVGGFLVQGGSGSRVTKNHTTVGRIPNGARIEREVLIQRDDDHIELALRAPDFTTAVRMASTIDGMMQQRLPPAEAEGGEAAPAAPRMAWARDAGTVIVLLPPADRERLPELISTIETLDVQADVPTRVIINERTGTVVLGDGVRLLPVAIAHGGLTVQINEAPQVSQPGPFANGETVVVPRTDVRATDVGGELHAVQESTSLGQVVSALNALGVTPRDLVAIIQALKAAGALRAEVVLQ